MPSLTVPTEQVIFADVNTMPPRDSQKNENKNLINRKKKSEVWYSTRNPGLKNKRPQLQIQLSLTCYKLVRNLQFISPSDKSVLPLPQQLGDSNEKIKLPCKVEIAI